MTCLSFYLFDSFDSYYQSLFDNPFTLLGNAWPESILCGCYFCFLGRSNFTCMGTSETCPVVKYSKSSQSIMQSHRNLFVPLRSSWLHDIHYANFSTPSVFQISLMFPNGLVKFVNCDYVVDFFLINNHVSALSSCAHLGTSSFLT